MPKQVYQCEFCGAIHDNKKLVVKCEQSHTVVAEIVGYRFDKSDKMKYPIEIKCKMSNGETVEYCIRNTFGLRYLD